MAREMKDSGVEWIREIPQGWDVRKIKHLFSVVAGATPKTDILDYWEGDIPWITPADYKTTDKYVETGRNFLTEKGMQSCGTSLIPSGSIIFSKRAPVGSVAITKNTLCTNQGCLSCIPYASTDSLFYYYAISVFTQQFELLSSGTTFKEISSTSFKNFSLPFPRIEIQQNIAAYLDKKCREIDIILDKTRSSIEEYIKLKQAVITQAVTKGIRGDRPMKDSGIEWIGEAPSHWDKTKVKWLLAERKDKSEFGNEEPLSMSQKYGLIPTRNMDIVPNIASSFVGAKLVQKQDLVFNKLKAHLGVFSVSNYDGLVSPDYAVYYSTGLADVKFLEYLFKTPQYITEFKKKSTGIAAGLTRLYTDGLYSIYCVLPPLDEQQQIVNYLNSKIGEIDDILLKKEQYLTEIEAYKKSLIYEYVTGKKEVQ